MAILVLGIKVLRDEKKDKSFDENPENFAADYVTSVEPAELEGGQKKPEKLMSLEKDFFEAMTQVMKSLSRKVGTSEKVTAKKDI